MNLKHLSDKELLCDTEKVAQLERETTTRLLWHLWEVQRRRLYAQCGTHSLFEYCVKVLKMSEPQAARRVNASRALAEFPELEEKINSGTLTLTATSQAQSFFNREAKADRPVAWKQKRQILSQLENLSTREADQVLLSHSPEPLTHRPEKCQALSAQLTEVRLTLDAETLSHLERLKEIWSHEMPSASFADVIKKMSVILRERLDPEIKAQRAVEKLKKSSSSPVTTPTLTPAPDETEAPVKIAQKNTTQNTTKPIPRLRTAIPSVVRHQVWLRDGGKCTYTDKASGRICGSRHRLQYDHAQPLALGGENTLENLRLRCFAHNQWHALQTFGRRAERGGPPLKIHPHHKSTSDTNLS